MKTEALIMLVSSQAIVIAFTIYFFYKVLTTPPRSEPDSYSENNEIER